jgi:hypothetical protein
MIIDQHPPKVNFSPFSDPGFLPRKPGKHSAPAYVPKSFNVIINGEMADLEIAFRAASKIESIGLLLLISLGDARAVRE